MSGESMVRAIASIDHEHFLHSFQPPSICPLATQQSIDGAVVLAAWFRRTQELSKRAPQPGAARANAHGGDGNEIDGGVLASCP